MKKNQRKAADERPPGRKADGETTSFGTWLRRQREAREIDLREIAETTKISLAYLKAFEEDRFEILPAEVFAKGFLRQYSRYVGLDPEEVVNFYLSARQSQAPIEEEEDLMATVEDMPAGTPAGSSPRLLYAGLAGLLILAAVVAFFLLSRRAGEPREAATPPPAVSEPAPTPAFIEPQTEELAQPPTVAEVDPDAAPLRVTFDFSSQCWIEVAVDGEQRVSELKFQGESLLIEAERYVEFKVGDYEAVEVEVNGRPFAFDETEGGSVRTERIELDGAAGDGSATAGA